jgi:hypothetical protein
MAVTAVLAEILAVRGLSQQVQAKEKQYDQ